MASRSLASLGKSSSSWKILDLLKIQSLPKPSRSPSASNINALAQITQNACKCCCCGTILACNEDTPKFHCVRCGTTNIFSDFDAAEVPTVPPIDYNYVKKQVDQCMAGPRAENSHELHEKFKPLLDYLLEAFGSISCLNHSFKIKKQSKRAHYSTCNINLDEVRRTFSLLAHLPSKRPLFCALTGVCNALKRLPMTIVDNPRNLYWLMILLEIPFLRRALTNSDKKPNRQPQSMAEVPEIQALCYEILKRSLGILSQTDVTSSGNYFASWFLKLPRSEFVAKVDLINLYITFHLKRYFYFANNPELARRASLGSVDYKRQQKVHRSGSIVAEGEYFECSYLKDEVEELNFNSAPWSNFQVSGNVNRKGAKKKGDAKVRVHQYSGNYHIRTAAGALGIFVKANYIRDGEDKLPMHSFYNSLVDYVNIKLDFDSWLSKKKLSKSESGEPDIQTIIDYIHGGGALLGLDNSNSLLAFYFCQYPFLITLGGKISILEYEARRQMERKAEEAFINSLDRRVALDVYFKVRVRRDYIVQDSLRCIQLNPANLKKSLKVQFINEPGVDAGGLKKEWFLLLTKALFSPKTGMLYNVKDSNLLWFNVIPIDNFEMYYLFGAVLGLAIYNSTILELKFPTAMYKILLGLPVGLADYQEIFPEAAENLFRLRNYSEEELESIGLNFEVSFMDVFGRAHQRELIPGGTDVDVTTNNREKYIDKYARFFLMDGMFRQLHAFKNGFSSVVDGNAFSLFLPEEMQLLLCGSEESRFDVDVLQSVTSYTGWSSKEEALKSPTVKWFWEYVSGLTFKQQKKVLMFITGSDRVPATGIQNLSLKISRLNNGIDSDRLPVAHTCFNELSIYEYSSREKMIDKLTKAVNMLAGFGIK
ncbi:CIC11C00000004050 [Sungouiella intermedia]|uniref:HECT-type E3 ubiquitin transferase n=1 Tax=Sungouiella intermedia TaxID=45354 RepID=A0A1L0D7E0_9ASCO|nr:CIC11C00000004050 [[Candida] intermedia]